MTTAPTPLTLFSLNKCSTPPTKFDFVLQTTYITWYMTNIQHINAIHQTTKPFLTTHEIKQLLHIKSTRTLEDTIKNLINNQILTRLEKGKYQITNHTASSFEIAQFLYSPSYISFETALNYHGILNQFPLTITSTSLKRSKLKTVNDIICSYTKLNTKLFIGYFKQGSSLIATPTKALFDYLYLVTKSIKTKNYLNEIDYSNINLNKFNQYLQLVSTNRQKLITQLLNQYI